MNKVKQKCFEVHGDKYDYSYIKECKYKEPMPIWCHTHGFFYVTYDNFINKHSECPYCRGLTRKTTKGFISELREIYGDVYDYSKVNYINAHTGVVLVCPKHGEFKLTPNKLLSRKNGCPECSKETSRLESIIRKGLVDDKIVFLEQQRFEWLGRMSLDFYVPSLGIAIECQGGQHFKDVYFKGIKVIEERNSFKEIYKRDCIKNELCARNGVRVLYFVCNAIPKEEVENKKLYKNNFWDYSYVNIINEVKDEHDRRTKEDIPQ